MVDRENLLKEIQLVQGDLLTFKRSKDEIHQRIQELEGLPHQEKFTSWAATQAIMNVLILTIVRCEGLIEDYHKILEEMDAPNNVIQLVQGDRNVGNGK